MLTLLDMDFITKILIKYDMGIDQSLVIINFLVLNAPLTIETTCNIMHTPPNENIEVIKGR